MQVEPEVLCVTQGVESCRRLRMWVCVYISACTGEDWREHLCDWKIERKTKPVRLINLIFNNVGDMCHHKPHSPCCVTLFCCTGCRSWRRYWTRGAASAAGTGPVGTASEGWSRGSGWPGLNRCAGYNQWDRKSRKKKQCNIYFFSCNIWTSMAQRKWNNSE